MSSVSSPAAGIRIFVTGGTFDKEYDEIHGRLFFQDTHVGEMLRLGRCAQNMKIPALPPFAVESSR